MTNSLFRYSEVARTNQTMQLEHKQKTSTLHRNVSGLPCQHYWQHESKSKSMTAGYAIMQHVQNFWTRGTTRASVHDAAETSLHALIYLICLLSEVLIYVIMYFIWSLAELLHMFLTARVNRQTAIYIYCRYKGKGKVIPLQARCGPEGG